MTLAFAGLYFQLRWQRGGKAGWMLLSGVCTAFSIWMKTFGLIFLVAQIILLILHAARQRRLGLLAWVLVLLVCWQGLDKGADDYLCKPFGIMEFISRVKAVLDVEMSIPAQLVLDVTLAVKDRCPIHTCLRSGGEIMSRERVVAAAKAILDKEGA